LIDINPRSRGELAGFGHRVPQDGAYLSVHISDALKSTRILKDIAASAVNREKP